MSGTVRPSGSPPAGSKSQTRGLASPDWGRFWAEAEAMSTGTDPWTPPLAGSRIGRRGLGRPRGGLSMRRLISLPTSPQVAQRRFSGRVGGRRRAPLPQLCRVEYGEEPPVVADDLGAHYRRQSAPDLLAARRHPLGQGSPRQPHSDADRAVGSTPWTAARSSSLCTTCRPSGDVSPL